MTRTNRNPTTTTTTTTATRATRARHPNHFSTARVRKFAAEWKRGATVYRRFGQIGPALRYEAVAEKLLQLATFHYRRVPIVEIHAAINSILPSNELLNDID